MVKLGSPFSLIEKELRACTVCVQFHTAVGLAWEGLVRVLYFGGLCCHLKNVNKYWVWVPAPPSPSLLVQAPMWFLENWNLKTQIIPFEELLHFVELLCMHILYMRLKSKQNWNCLLSLSSDSAWKVKVIHFTIFWFLQIDFSMGLALGVDYVKHTSMRARDSESEKSADAWNCVGLVLFTLSLSLRIRTLLVEKIESSQIAITEFTYFQKREEEGEQHFYGRVFPKSESTAQLCTVRSQSKAWPFCFCQKCKSWSGERDKTASICKLTWPLKRLRGCTIFRKIGSFK